MTVIPDPAFREYCNTCQERTDCPFAELPSAIVRRFQEIRQLKCYSQGVALFLQGEEAGGLFIVRSGWVKLFHLTAVGKVRSLGLFSNGSVLGLPEILTGDEYRTSAEVLEDSRLDYVAKKQFMQFLLDHPAAAVRLLRKGCQDMQRFLTELYQTVGEVSLDERLLHVLLDLCKTCGHSADGGIKLQLSFTVQDLADRIGCSRQWASGLLRDLQAQGLIQRKGGWITLTPRALNGKGPSR